MQPWNQADATDNWVKQIRFHSMCQIRKLCVTAGEGKACLERGQGWPVLCVCHWSGSWCALSIPFYIIHGRRLAPRWPGSWFQCYCSSYWFERPHSFTVTTTSNSNPPSVCAEFALQMLSYEKRKKNLGTCNQEYLQGQTTTGACGPLRALDLQFTVMVVCEAPQPFPVCRQIWSSSAGYKKNLFPNFQTWYIINVELLCMILPSGGV